MHCPVVGNSSNPPLNNPSKSNHNNNNNSSEVMADNPAIDATHVLLETVGTPRLHHPSSNSNNPNSNNNNKPCQPKTPGTHNLLGVVPIGNNKPTSQHNSIKTTNPIKHALETPPLAGFASLTPPTAIVFPVSLVVAGHAEITASLAAPVPNLLLKPMDALTVSTSTIANFPHANASLLIHLPLQITT